MKKMVLVEHGLSGLLLIFGVKISQTEQVKSFAQSFVLHLELLEENNVNNEKNLAIVDFEVFVHLFKLSVIQYPNRQELNPA